MSTRVDFDAETARVLLDLADNPKVVKTDTQGPDMVLVVPDDLWAKYETYQGLKEKKKGK